MTTRGLRTRSWMAAAIMLCVLLASASVASADQITVLCSNGFKAVLQDLAPQFEKATKHEVVIRYSVSAELKRRIEGGEVFDVAILTPGESRPILVLRSHVPALPWPSVVARTNPMSGTWSH